MAKKTKKSPTKLFDAKVIKNLLASKQGRNIANTIVEGKGLGGGGQEDTSKPWWLRTKNPYEYYSGGRSSLIGMTPERTSKARQMWDNILNYRDNLNEDFWSQYDSGTSAMTKKSGFTMKRGNRPNKHEFFKGKK
jgi:hypothetical protein